MMMMMMMRRRRRIMKNKDSCAIMFFYSSYETTFTKVVQNIFEVNLQSSQFKKSPHFFPLLMFSQHVLVNALRALLKIWWSGKASMMTLPIRELSLFFNPFIFSVDTFWALLIYHAIKPCSLFLYLVKPQYWMLPTILIISYLYFYICQISIFTFGKNFERSFSHNNILHHFPALFRGLISSEFLSFPNLFDFLPFQCNQRNKF